MAASETFDYKPRHNIWHFRYREVQNVFLSLCAAEQHWFFLQGHDAYLERLYLPALSSLLNGIEASLRVTLHLLNKDKEHPDIWALSPYRVLSNKLILQAQEAGMPVQYLAFSEEKDFLENLKSDNRVEIVELRNDICHGNVTKFINTELGPEESFFVPDLLRTVTEKVLAISVDWCQALAHFRKANGFSHYDPPDVPKWARRKL